MAPGVEGDQNGASPFVAGTAVDIDHRLRIGQGGFKVGDRLINWAGVGAPMSVTGIWHRSIRPSVASSASSPKRGAAHSWEELRRDGPGLERICLAHKGPVQPIPLPAGGL